MFLKLKSVVFFFKLSVIWALKFLGKAVFIIYACKDWAESQESGAEQIQLQSKLS